MPLLTDKTCLGGGTCLPAGRLVDAPDPDACRYFCGQNGKVMTYYVYVISSNFRSYIYVGITNNVQRRLKEHNSGKNTTTKPYAPFDIILTEKYNDRPTARMREKFLKSGCGKEWIKKMR